MTWITGNLLTNYTITCEDENRLTSIGYPGGTDTHIFNALGQKMRTMFAGPGCVRRYFYNGDRVLEETNDGGGVYVRYLTESGSYYDQLLGFGRCNGEERYPMGVYPERSRRDAVGTVQRLTDQFGAVTHTYTYDAFGKLYSLIASMASTKSGPAQKSSFISCALLRIVKRKS